MPNEPTPARRAALKLRTIYGGDNITLETVERVINEETALPEVLAAFEAITQHSIQFFGMGSAGGKESDIANAALSALAKAKGGK